MAISLILVPSMINLIGNVKLDRLAYLGKIVIFLKKVFASTDLTVQSVFLSDALLANSITCAIGRKMNNPQHGFPKQFVTNRQDFDSIEPMETTQATFDHSLWENPMGEAHKDALRLDFDRKLKLGFRGVKVTSDAGLLTFRELDEAFGFTAMINSKLTDIRSQEF